MKTLMGVSEGFFDEEISSKMLPSLDETLDQHLQASGLTLKISVLFRAAEFATRFTDS